MLLDLGADMNAVDNKGAPEKPQNPRVQGEA